MMLLEINALNDTHFTLRDLIYIIGLVVTVLTAFWRLKASSKDAHNRMDNIEKDVETRSQSFGEKLVAGKNGRHAMKKELQEDINKVEDVSNKRIDKANNKMEQYQSKISDEFSKINDKMELMSKDTGEIKGMLSQIINKN